MTLSSIILSAIVLAQIVPAALLASAPPALEFSEGNQPRIVSTQTLLPRIYQAEPPQKTGPSLGLEITAAAAFVWDPASGKVLFQKNTEGIRSIASLTKLMTALVFLDHNPGFEQEVEIVETDLNSEGSLGLRQGDRLRIRDLFYASLVHSANDATQALARVTGLPADEFVAEMNKWAKGIGLENTKFTDASGLDQDNVSTALELARLADFAFHNAEIAEATLIPEYEFTVLNTDRVIRFKNTNQLLDSFLSLSGGKTGYTEEAGYSLVVRANDGQGHYLIVLVLGSATSADRFQEVKGLASWSFENWRWP